MGEVFRPFIFGEQNRDISITKTFLLKCVHSVVHALPHHDKYRTLLYFFLPYPFLLWRAKKILLRPADLIWAKLLGLQLQFAGDFIGASDLRCLFLYGLLFLLRIHRALSM